MAEEHYEIVYTIDGNIKAMYCNHCDYSITRLEVRPSKTGHRWPYMSHNIKKHLKEKHDINLYKRNSQAIGFEGIE